MNTDRPKLLALDMNIPCTKEDANGGSTLSPRLYVLSMQNGLAREIDEIDLKIMRSGGNLFVTPESLQKIEATGFQHLTKTLPLHIFGMLKNATFSNEPPDALAENFWTENTTFCVHAKNAQWVPVNQMPRKKIGLPKIPPAVG